MLKNIESKVYAAAGGTGAGAVVSAFVLWVLGVLAWGAPANAAGAQDAIAAVPMPVQGLVGLTLTVAGAAIAGYMADHTERPDLQDVVEGGAGAGEDASTEIRPVEDSN